MKRQERSNRKARNKRKGKIRKKKKWLRKNNNEIKKEGKKETKNECNTVGHLSAFAWTHNNRGGCLFVHLWLPFQPSVTRHHLNLGRQVAYCCYWWCLLRWSAARQVTWTSQLCGRLESVKETGEWQGKITLSEDWRGTITPGGSDEGR